MFDILPFTVKQEILRRKLEKGEKKFEKLTNRLRLEIDKADEAVRKAELKEKGKDRKRETGRKDFMYLKNHFHDSSTQARPNHSTKNTAGVDSAKKCMRGCGMNKKTFMRDPIVFFLSLCAAAARSIRTS